MAATRRLPTEGMFNLRDLGGCRTADGGAIKPGRLLRGDDLYPATPGDLSLLAGLPLVTVIDFRDESEKEAFPDKLPETVRSYLELPIEVGNILDIMDLGRRGPADLMIEVYESLVRDCRQVYQEFFRIVMLADSAPLLYHCTAGKDRTGFATALLLRALGVPRETILADYQSSTDFIRPKYADYLDANPGLGPFLECRESYLRTAFDLIENEFGGFDHYLTRTLKADPGKLKSLYLD